MQCLIIEAQIISDRLLEFTVELIQEIMKINGGERAGNNLFHSFEDFNIPEGMEASFQNALDIENIFARVTGDSISNIDGILSAQGGANLFLMNPNGIVFGLDASINVDGSFVATTTDSIQFADGTEFATTDVQSDSVLNVGYPVGLEFGDRPNGEIEVRGAGNEITPTPPISPTQIENSDQGLQVSSGNTIGLVGSGVTVDGGTLTAENGNIELGSVGSGVVSIRSTQSRLTFDYSQIDTYQNITLTKQAVLNSSGQAGGAIALTGNNVTFEDNSVALITNQGTSNSGDINIEATETFNLSGTSEDRNVFRAIRSETIGSGAGANVSIFTGNLLIPDAAVISTITFADGLGGNVSVDAKGAIELATGGFGSTTYGSGNAGNIQVSAQQIRAINGSNIGSPTVGTGDGGNVSVRADSIELVGTNETESSISSIFAASASTGNAGNVTVDTSELRLTDGAIIDSSSIAKGNAGSVIVNASEFIEITGQSQSPTEPQSSGINSSVAIPSQVFQQAFGLDSEPSGQAGNVVVNTSLLAVNQGGQISVENEGTGDAGTLSINANDVNLDSSGSITAASASGTGGNIELNTDNLRINSNSQITATAQNQAGGGKIDINATNITAKKNSVISANAAGGNIEITTDSIVGFEERAELTPYNFV